MNEPQMNYGRSTTAARAGAVDEGLRKYMLGVYNYMALGVAATGVFSLLLASNEALIYQIFGTPLKWLPFVGIIGVGMIAPRIIFSGSKIAAHAMFWVYAALWGVLISGWLFMFQQADAAREIYRAFFITASVFGGLSLWGYTTKKDLSGWGIFLGMAMLGLLVAIIVNIFIASTMFSLLTSIGVVLVVSALTAYETQMVKSMYVEGQHAGNERAAIFGAFALYASFVTLFIHILNILGIMRN